MKSPITRHSSLSSVLLVLLLGIFAMLPPTTLGFEFQHDSDTDQCAKDVDLCTRDAEMWYKCPISCSQKFEKEGLMAEERDDPEQLFLLEVTRSDGTSLSLEENEGYLTLFAVLPLLPGMAQFYYDAIEHIAHVYKYTVVPMILPILPSDGSDDSNVDDEFIKPVPNAKSVLLKTGDTSNPVLKYLLTRKPVAGNHDLDFTTDRPTIFIVSHTGLYIERTVAPTMEMLERRIKVHEWAMTEKEL